jgi:hypothetical protein
LGALAAGAACGAAEGAGVAAGGVWAEAFPAAIMRKLKTSAIAVDAARNWVMIFLLRDVRVCA